MDSYISSWSAPTTVREVSQETIVRYVNEQVIPLFEKQREKSQFAAIILCSRDDCDSELQRIKYSPSDSFRRPLTDSTQPMMPNENSDFDNYITAKPYEGHHAEHILLSQIDNLYAAFTSKHGKPYYIILYTWITPCSNCAKLIIEKLSQQPYSDIPRVVAHTTNTHKKGDDVQTAKHRLREAGITVLEVPHQKLHEPTRRLLFM